MRLNFREKQIIVHLLNNKYSSGHQLAKYLKISERSVRHDIKNLNSKLNVLSIQISGDTQKGYSLKANESERQHLFDLLQEEDIVSLKEEPEYRRKMMLLYLIENNSCNIFDLAEYFYVSESTIKNDLKKIDNILKKGYSAFTIKKHGNELSLQGKESNIRTGISSVMVGEYSDLDIAILNNLSSGVINFKEINSIIFELLKCSKKMLSNDKILYISLVCFITLVRIENNHKVEMIEVDDQNTKIESEVEEVFKKLAGLYDMEIDSSEIYHISQLISALKSTEFDKVINKELFDQVKEISTNIDFIYGTKFNQDTEFLTLISNHISSQISEEILSMGLTKNIINEIKESFPYAHNLAEYLIDALQNSGIAINKDLKEGLITFCAVHIQTSIERNTNVKKTNVMIVTHLGQTETRLLEAQLVNELQNLEINKIITTYDLPNESLDGIDLIIATRYLETDVKVPCVFVKIPLNLDQLEKIKEAMVYPYDWFKDVYPIVINVPEHVNDTRSAIDYIESVVSIIEGREVDIAKLLWKRESIMSSIVGDYIAMPHALIEDNFSYYFYFFHHKKGMDWGGEVVHLIATILINSRIKEHINEYMKLVYNLNDNKNIKNLTSSSVSKLLNYKEREY